MDKQAMSDIVKQGYVKFQSKNLGVWKKRWLVLKMHSKKGPVRLEKYEDEIAALNGTKHRMIDLSRIENIYRVPDCEKRHAIHITLDSMESVQFCLDSELEAESWIKMIQGEIQGAQHNRDTFEVYLMKHPKLPTYGECTMEVTDTSIRLLNHREQEIIAWPLNKLRKYGVERSMFTIEAGRSCPSGEGIFVFESEAAEDIYSRVHNVTKSQALLKNSGDHQSTNNASASSGRNTNTNKRSDNASSYGHNIEPPNSKTHPTSKLLEVQSNWGKPSSLKELSEKPNDKRVKGNEYGMSQEVNNSRTNRNYGAGADRSRDNRIEEDENGGEYTEVPSNRRRH